MSENQTAFIPRLLDAFVTHSYIFAFILLFIFLSALYREWRAGRFAVADRLWVVAWLVLYLSLIYFSSRYFSVAKENGQLRKELWSIKNRE